MDEMVVMSPLQTREVEHDVVMLVALEFEELVAELVGVELTTPLFQLVMPLGKLLSLESQRLGHGFADEYDSRQTCGLVGDKNGRLADENLMMLLVDMNGDVHHHISHIDLILFVLELDAAGNSQLHPTGPLVSGHRKSELVAKMVYEGL